MTASRPHSVPHDYDGGSDAQASDAPRGDAGVEGHGSSDLRAPAASSASVDRPPASALSTPVSLAQSVAAPKPELDSAETSAHFERANRVVEWANHYGDDLAGALRLDPDDDAETLTVIEDALWCAWIVLQAERL